MSLSHIQHQLQTIYDIPLDYRVEDFLVTDSSTLNTLTRGQNIRHSVESLLISEQDNELHLSLYLNQQLLEELNKQNPYTEIEKCNLSTFCTVCEGVSHFVYLAFNAGHERPVSQLELELQAEVDKFVSVLQLSEQQNSAFDGHDLARWLFDECTFDPSLNHDERERYSRANQLAKEFCHQLMDRHSRQVEQNVYSELRRFYRKRHIEKLTLADNNSGMPAP